MWGPMVDITLEGSIVIGFLYMEIVSVLSMQEIVSALLFLNVPLEAVS